MKKIVLAIVVPCYNEEEILSSSIEKLLNLLEELIISKRISSDSFILFVDDGSIDRTWEIIKESTANKTHIKAIRFSRNFGHQNAVYAGLMYTKDKSDCVVSIDADLQQDEKAIKLFLEKYYEGYEIVNGVRNNREADVFFKKLSATFFYKLMKFMGVNIIENSADYRLVSSKVLKELARYEEVNLFLRGIFPSLGFNSTTLEHSVCERSAGKSKYSFTKMLNLAIDGITSFSIVPLRLISILGLISLLFCLAMGVYVLYTVLFTDNAIQGWASTVLPLYLIGSIQVLSLGIIGEYIGKIYVETKHRPKYIIREEI